MVSQVLESMSNNKYSYINPECLYELGDGEDEFVKEIIGDVLKLVPESIDMLKQATESNNEKDIIFYAHKLKGTFRFIGCNELGDLMEQVEKQDLSTEENQALVNKMIEGYGKAEVEFNDLLQ